MARKKKNKNRAKEKRFSVFPKVGEGKCLLVDTAKQGASLEPLKIMKVTIVKSNLEAQISGTPAIVTFTITQKNINAFNLSQGGGIKNAPSYNENVNKERGLPCPEVRQWLRSIYSSEFGIMQGKLTMGIVKKYIS